jgi:hypothetical protein
MNARWKRTLLHMLVPLVGLMPLSAFADDLANAQLAAQLEAEQQEARALDGQDCRITPTNLNEADQEAMVGNAAARFGVQGKTCFSSDISQHAGGECAKRGQTINQECIDRGVLDYDCRQTRNPNPNDTPEQCVERRLAGGPKWLAPGATPSPSESGETPAADEPTAPEDVSTDDEGAVAAAEAASAAQDQRDADNQASDDAAEDRDVEGDASDLSVDDNADEAVDESAEGGDEAGDEPSGDDEAEQADEAGDTETEDADE